MIPPLSSTVRHRLTVSKLRIDKDRLEFKSTTSQWHKPNLLAVRITGPIIDQKFKSFIDSTNWWLTSPAQEFQKCFFHLKWPVACSKRKTIRLVARFGVSTCHSLPVSAALYRCSRRALMRLRCATSLVLRMAHFWAALRALSPASTGIIASLASSASSFLFSSSSSALPGRQRCPASAA